MGQDTLMPRPPGCLQIDLQVYGLLCLLWLTLILRGQPWRVPAKTGGLIRVSSLEGPQCGSDRLLG